MSPANKSQQAVNMRVILGNQREYFLPALSLLGLTIREKLFQCEVARIHQVLGRVTTPSEAHTHWTVLPQLLISYHFLVLLFGNVFGIVATLLTVPLVTVL